MFRTKLLLLEERYREESSKGKDMISLSSCWIRNFTLLSYFTFSSLNQDKSSILILSSWCALILLLIIFIFDLHLIRKISLITWCKCFDIVITGEEIHKVSKTLEKSEPILTVNSIFGWGYLVSIEFIHIIIKSASQSSAKKGCQNSSTTKVINVNFTTSCLPIKENHAAKIRWDFVG